MGVNRLLDGSYRFLHLVHIFEDLVPFRFQLISIANDDLQLHS